MPEFEIFRTSEYSESLGLDVNGSQHAIIEGLTFEEGPLSVVYCSDDSIVRAVAALLDLDINNLTRAEKMGEIVFAIPQDSSEVLERLKELQLKAGR